MTTVAVKAYSIRHSNLISEYLKMASRETEILSSIKHPNIVKFLGAAIGESNTELFQFFIIQEKLDVTLTSS